MGYAPLSAPALGPGAWRNPHRGNRFLSPASSMAAGRKIRFPTTSARRNMPETDQSTPLPRSPPSENSGRRRTSDPSFFTRSHCQTAGFPVSPCIGKPAARNSMDGNPASSMWSSAKFPGFISPRSPNGKKTANHPPPAAPPDDPQAPLQRLKPESHRRRSRRLRKHRPRVCEGHFPPFPRQFPIPAHRPLHQR